MTGDPMPDLDDDFDDDGEEINDTQTDERILGDVLGALEAGDPDLALDHLRDGLNGDAHCRAADECEALIREGRVDDAVHRLRLFLSPKFASLAICREAYGEAMRVGYEASRPHQQDIFGGLAA